MMEYLRDMHISLEMCPASNLTTCRYRNFSNRQSDILRNEDAEIYPLRHYLNEGVGVTINTDNRGISRTTLTGEFLKACHLTEGGLSKWDILRIIRQGFLSGFLPLQQKNLLLHQAERDILSILIHEYLEKH